MGKRGKPIALLCRQRTDNSAQQEAVFQSKHGMILSCSIVCPGIDHVNLQKMEEMLSGSRYGFTDDLTSSFSGSTESATVRCNEILSWLLRTTRS